LVATSINKSERWYTHILRMKEDRIPKTVLAGNKIKIPKIKMGTSQEEHGKK
jgi:hypothetical protein